MSIKIPVASSTTSIDTHMCGGHLKHKQSTGWSENISPQQQQHSPDQALWPFWVFKDILFNQATGWSQDISFMQDTGWFFI